MSYAQADPGYNDEHVTAGGGFLDNLGPCSVACVYDPPNNTMTLYRNGALVSSLSPVTTTNNAKQFSLTNVYNVNSWIGRSLYNGDGAYNGTLDEFRIYNSALSQVDVAVHNALGPDVVATNYTLTGASWTVNTNMIVGERQDSAALVSFTYNGTQTASASVVGFVGPAYSSADTNIVTITPAGRLFAMAAGSTTVTAVYSPFTFNIPVTVSATPTLLHRYSFTTDASDSVGTADGTLMGTATISSGAVVLSGVGNSSSDPEAYVELPGQLFTNLTSVSLETWVTDSGSSQWARIWDFGISETGQGNSGGGGDNLFLTPYGAGLRGSINVGAQGEQQVNTANLPVGKESYVVWMNDAAHHSSYLYVNGVLVAQNSSTTDTPADLRGTLNDWLGRSQYGDPMWNGSIDEFRIWQGQLSPLQVAINAASGPDKLLLGSPGPASALHLTLNANMVRDGVQNATVTADFASVTGVNITSAGVVYTSSNTNVATVNATGYIQAVDIGTTTITATYGSASDNKVITVVVKPTVLAHRWNFNDAISSTTVKDVVGSADGTLSAGGATLDGTSVALDGLSGYVDLPGHLIDGFDAVTFESWINVDPNTLPDTLARIFEFGSVDVVNEIGATALGGDLHTHVQYFDPSGYVGMLRHQGLNTLGKVHLVVNFDPPQGTIDLYLNGHWQNTITNLTFSLSSITNLAGRLGANLGGTNFTAVTFDDFRIYNGALDLLGIRENFAAGPDLVAVATNLGTPTSLTLKIDASMVQGSRGMPHAWASFATVTNVDLTQTAQIAYSSSDPTVVSITSDGLLQAVGPGSATVTATFSGLTATKTVTVYPKQTMLVHRYSFTSDASDSVGAQDGYLWGNAIISGNQVAFDSDPNSYVELPSRMISSYDSVSFEFWASIASTSQDVGSHLRLRPLHRPG